MAVFHGPRAFYAITFGQFVSLVGSGMTRFGLGIWVLRETGDTTAYTAMLFFAILPMGLGSIFTGTLVDIWNRRIVMLAGNAVASLSTLVAALLFFSGVLEIWHLYIVLIVNGLANAFVGPSMEASVPMLVKRGEPRTGIRPYSDGYFCGGDYRSGDGRFPCRVRRSWLHLHCGLRYVRRERRCAASVGDSAARAQS